jgi:hypothetical protein
MPTDFPSLGIDILHSLHGPGFALLALAILWYLQHQCRSVVNYILAATIAMGIGLVSEIAQIPGARDAQVQDLVVDALGIFGAIGVSASLDRKVRAAIRTWARLALPTSAGVALAIACVPTIWLSHALIQQNRAFPQLLTFEHAWEGATYSQPEKRRPSTEPAPVNWPTGGQTIARARESGRWGIFISLKPLPDWRGYERLSFVAASAGEPTKIDIGVKDVRRREAGKEQSRFYKALQVDSTPKRYTVAFAEIEERASDRPFDFSRVESIVLSAANPGTNVEVLIDDFRLD